MKFFFLIIGNFFLSQSPTCMSPNKTQAEWLSSPNSEDPWRTCTIQTIFTLPRRHCSHQRKIPWNNLRVSSCNWPSLTSTRPLPTQQAGEDGSDLKVSRDAGKFSHDHKHPRASERNPEKTWCFPTLKTNDSLTRKSRPWWIQSEKPNKCKNRKWTNFIARIINGTKGRNTKRCKTDVTKSSAKLRLW